MISPFFFGHKLESFELKLYIYIKATCLAAHPFMPLAAVGTSKGHVVFIDFSHHLYPRILENCNLHKEETVILKYAISY